MKKCTKCKVEKELSHFFQVKSRKDGFHSHCKECHHISSKNNYNNNKEKHKNRNEIYKGKIDIIYFEYLNNKCCKKCGENRIYLLDHHHIDPSIKEFDISYIRRRGNKIKLENEIKKCIILCSNCHREFHHLEKLNNINIENYLHGVSSLLVKWETVNL